MSLGSDRMNKNIRRCLVLVGTLLIIIGLVACGGEVIDQADHVSTDPQGAVNNTDEPNVSKETNTLTFYYVDGQLMEVLQEERDIHFSSEEEKWQEIWSALQLPQDDNMLSLWHNVDLIEAELLDSQLVLNLSLPDQMELGSSGEGFAIQTLINTFGQVKDVNTIQLLIDGESIETLAGHVLIKDPFSKDDIIYTGEHVKD
jgi:spore germination protein GerM